MQIFLLLVVIVLLLISRAQLLRQIKDLGQSVQQLRKAIILLEKSRKEERTTQPSDEKAEPAPEKKKAPQQPEVSTPATPATKPPPKPDPKPVMAHSPNLDRPRPLGQSGAKGKSTPPPKKEPSPTFFERYPDIEKFVGENLINKIGIGILVLGIGFFVKYAIDQNWINEVARTAIGILCGGILIGLAHRLRNSYKPFSSVLVGGGLAVLYFTIAIAYHEYQIIGQVAAFVIMVIITGFSVVLSLTYDRMELAILSILGGFSTPFILSSGEGNYVVLFTYLAILNTGMLVLAYYKKWYPVNVISYVFTVLIYAAWLIGKALSMDEPPYGHALFFATLFYILFFLMNIVNNVMSNRKFDQRDIAILLSNTFLYYSAGMVILISYGSGMYKGVFTALLAVFNFAFAFALFRKVKVDRNLVYLLIGLVLTFVSLTAPVQLEGNYITLFWAAEAVLLLWLSIRSGIKLMTYASLLIAVLMIISLGMDWIQLYVAGHDSLPIIINKAFITGLFSTAAIYGIRRLSKDHFMSPDLPTNMVRDFRNVLQAIFGALLYLVGLFEFNYQLDQYLAYYPSASVILASYHFIAFLVIIYIAHRRQQKPLMDFATLLGGVGLLSYLMVYNSRIIKVRNFSLIESDSQFFAFLYHYVDLVLIVGILFTLTILFRNKMTFIHGLKRYFYWFISIYLLVLLSIELDHLVSWLSFHPGRSINATLEQNHKIGFPILWGILSFGLMWLGMRRKIKDIRIISLAILALTIAKLFIYDIRDVSEGGKIAAFICLGVLLLVISFMYQKLKKLLLDDEKDS